MIKVILSQQAAIYTLTGMLQAEQTHTKDLEAVRDGLKLIIDSHANISLPEGKEHAPLALLAGISDDNRHPSVDL